MERGGLLEWSGQVGVEDHDKRRSHSNTAAEQMPFLSFWCFETGSKTNCFVIRPDKKYVAVGRISVVCSSTDHSLSN